jgi:hypothetical protein
MLSVRMSRKKAGVGFYLQPAEREQQGTREQRKQVKDLTAHENSVRTYLWALDRQKEMKEVADRERAVILEALGDNDTGSLNGEPILTRTWQKRKTLDTKALQRERPEIAELFSRTSEVETLRRVK